MSAAFGDIVGTFVDHVDVATTLTPALRIPVAADIKDKGALPGDGALRIGSNIRRRLKSFARPTVTAYGPTGDVVYQWAPYGAVKGSWGPVLAVLGALVGVGFVLGRYTR